MYISTCRSARQEKEKGVFQSHGSLGLRWEHLWATAGHQRSLRLRLRRQKYIIPNTLPNKFENLFLSIRKVEDFSKIPVYKFAKPVFFSLLPLHFSFLFPNRLARVHTYTPTHALSEFPFFAFTLHLANNTININLLRWRQDIELTFTLPFPPISPALAFLHRNTAKTHH